MTPEPTPRCAECSAKRKYCWAPDAVAPSICPTVSHETARAAAAEEYAREDVGEFARLASIQEAECYANRTEEPYYRQPVKPRVLEVIEFAKRLGAPRVGVAFCSGLQSEARVLDAILRAHGLEVVSVACKVGQVPKEQIGVRSEEKVHIGQFESMCNPIAQAKILNHEQTGLNITLGLCVGHDSLFFKYSDAPVTVLVAKDRVLGHNPIAALYTAGSYSERLLHPTEMERSEDPGCEQATDQG